MPIAHNTIAKYCKNLKRIINYGKEKGLIKENPFEHFQIGYKDIDRSYLTATELQLLEQKHIPIKRLEVIRDLFLFQCYTGLSFIDMAQLGKDNIIEGIDKKSWIYSCRHKTKVKYTVPLLPQALKIIEKYKNYKDDNNNLILPVMSNQKFNAYLKEIATICGINKELSSHVGRRTFATTIALGNGISMESIAKMLGHTNTKITSIYAVVTDIKLSQEMGELSSRFSEHK